MSEHILQYYPEWLIQEVEIPVRRNYDELLGLLHAKEFVWIVPNDDNRVQDGQDIRHEFFRAHNIKRYVDVDILGAVSVLEVLIGLSRRMGFMTSVRPEDCAWELLENLELTRMSGHIGNKRANEINDILERLIWRTYLPNGEGGFFPLRGRHPDQRDVELWYQMSAYLIENYD